MIKVIAMLKKKSGLTMEEFSRYWYEKHAPLLRVVVPEEVLSLQRRYIQNHAVNLPRGGEPPFDAVAEICFDDFESLQKWNDWYFSDNAKALRDDEENFMDKSKRIIVVTDERVMSHITNRSG